MQSAIKYDGPIVNRAQALAAGQLRYFTGKACPHGHFDQRYVSCYGCLSCMAGHTEKYVKADPDRWKRMGKSWRADNPDKLIAKAAKWKNVRRQYDKEWRKKNIEAVQHSARAWAKRSRATPEGRVASSMRVHIRRCVREKNFKSFEIVGYSPSELVSHIERQFSKGMSWSNYGDWHIDHINSIKWHTDQGITCPAIINALTNLRPLWATDNLSKGCARTHLI